MQPINTQGLPNANLQTGSTGPAVLALQNWLVKNGYMTQQQVNTGPGTYGPQTTAAVTKLQQALGVNNSTGPGDFGPLTQAAIQKAASAPQAAPGGAGAGSGGPQVAGAATTGTGGSTGTGGTTQPITAPGSTGNANLDSIQTALTGVANNLISTGYTIPSDLQITPALVSDFLSIAHQAVDPYTQQLISGELANINNSLSQMQTDYQNSVGQTEQNFGDQLSTEQNAAGGSGTAFSGLRTLGENNMAASTNRTLSSLAADTGAQESSALQTAAGQLGSANTGGIVLPNLSTGSVSLAGGARGSSNTGGAIPLNYNPSIYTVGSIPSAQTQAVNQQQQSYLSQYGTLAGAQSNSGQTMAGLVGQISGLPSGFTLPTNLT